MTTDKQEIADEIRGRIDFYNSMQQIIDDRDRLSEENITFADSIKRLTEERDVLVAENADLLKKETSLNGVGKKLQLKLNNFKALIEEKNQEIRDLKKQIQPRGKLGQTPQETKSFPAKKSVEPHPVLNNGVSNDCKKGLIIVAGGVKGIHHKLEQLQERCPDVKWEIKIIDGRTTRGEFNFLKDIGIVVLIIRGQKHKHTDWVKDRLQLLGVPYFVGSGMSEIIESINRNRAS